jgi:hypothetical protein
MDHRAFDALTRMFSGGAGPRRAVVRLLAGSAFAGLAARLGQGEAAQAKSKKHEKRHGDKEQPGHLHAAGKKDRKRKKKDKHKPRGICDNGRPKCPDGSCVPVGECCPGRVRCDDGFCHAGCCPGYRLCPGGGQCVKEGECCLYEKECDDGTCVSQDECCPGYWECPGGGCGKIGDCCPGTHRCGETSCIPIDECCEEDKPQCGGCSELTCYMGEWICEPAQPGEECPADPARCCPTHLPYPIHFCHEDGRCCYHEGGSSSVFCLAV